MLDAAATVFASILVLGGGFAFALHKMENAFKPGDPVLEPTAKDKQIPNMITDEDTDE
jgi:hypothetical protein